LLVKVWGRRGLCVKEFQPLWIVRDAFAAHALARNLERALGILTGHERQGFLFPAQARSRGIVEIRSGLKAGDRGVMTSPKG
jgi:hypothetical protein